MTDFVTRGSGTGTTPREPQEWARENVATAHHLMLATLEVLLIRRAELDAKRARLQCALMLNDDSVLRPGDVPEEPTS